jgi:hypothetical protein
MSKTIGPKPPDPRVASRRNPEGGRRSDQEPAAAKAGAAEPPVISKTKADGNAADARLHRLYRRRGTLMAAIGQPGSSEWPSCTVCGEADIRCLEAHHFAGRCDDAQVIVCANCHCKLSDMQYDNTPWINTHTTSRRFYGLADLLRLMAEGLESDNK